MPRYAIFIETDRDDNAIVTDLQDLCEAKLSIDLDANGRFYDATVMLIGDPEPSCVQGGEVLGLWEYDGAANNEGAS